METHYCKIAFNRKLVSYSQSIQSFMALALQIKPDERVKFGSFQSSKGQTCGNWENPGQLVEPVSTDGMGSFLLKFGWVGAGKSPKTEPV